MLQRIKLAIMGLPEQAERTHEHVRRFDVFSRLTNANHCTRGENNYETYI